MTAGDSIIRCLLDTHPLRETVIRSVIQSLEVLPGYSLLEARLNATCSGYLPYLKDTAPELHFLRALSRLRYAGLEAVEARTFVGDVRSPLTTGEQTALASLFGMLWGERRPEVLPEDWAAYQRLCVPGSPDFIAQRPDYYGFITYSMFAGRVPLG
jgi:hypothetical protein